MPPAISPARMFRRAVSRSIGRSSISRRGGAVALDVRRDRHREEQRGQVGEGVEVGLQGPAALAAAVEAGGGGDKNRGPEERGGGGGGAPGAGAGGGGGGGGGGD